jgi:hypothetical protein
MPAPEGQMPVPQLGWTHPVPARGLLLPRPDLLESLARILARA